MGTAGIADALADLLGAPVDGLRRLSGGASRETWAFTCGGRELILRRDPPGRPGEPGRMRLEADAMRACARAGLPVPEVLVDDDGARLGTAGLVMSRVAGETLARRILRDDDYAEARPRLPAQIGRFLAGLHAVDPAELPGLEPLDPHARYREAYEEVDDVSPTFELAYRWLDGRQPAPAEQVVVHGDLRLGNLIVDGDGLAAVIDWELVHLGDPVEDLAWVCVKAWRFGGAGEVAGVGGVDELLDAYESVSGRTVDRAAFHWWLVEKTLEWGVMCMGQANVHLSGLLRSVELAAIGRRVAEQEWDLLELLEPEAWAAARRAAPVEPADGPGIHPRPTAAELLDATRGFLTDTVMPSTEGIVSFHARVAANVLGIVERQLLLGPAQEARARDALASLGFGSFAELAGAVRDGSLDAGRQDLIGFLAATVRDRLAVANPKHLGR